MQASGSHDGACTGWDSEHTPPQMPRAACNMSNSKWNWTMHIHVSYVIITRGFIQIISQNHCQTTSRHAGTCAELTPSTYHSMAAMGKARYGNHEMWTKWNDNHSKAITTQPPRNQTGRLTAMLRSQPSGPRAAQGSEPALGDSRPDSAKPVTVHRTITDSALTRLQAPITTNNYAPPQPHLRNSIGLISPHISVPYRNNWEMLE